MFSRLDSVAIKDRHAPGLMKPFVGGQKSHERISAGVTADVRVLAYALAAILTCIRTGHQTLSLVFKHNHAGLIFIAMHNTFDSKRSGAICFILAEIFAGGKQDWNDDEKGSEHVFPPIA